MSAVEGIGGQYALLPGGRDSYYWPLLPQKTSSPPPARQAATPIIIEADTVILGSDSEWRVPGTPEVPSPNPIVLDEVPKEKSDRPFLLWLLALKAYENQMPALHLARATGLQVNIVA